MYVSIDKPSFILVINIVILKEIIVSLDIANFLRVRQTNKGPILREKSVNGLLRAPRTEFCTLQVLCVNEW